VTRSSEFHTDVVIVGTGPTGSAAALALSTYGVKVYMVTRHGWVSNTPRAHITNQRTMEVLRDLDVSKEVTLYGSSWELMGDTLFTTSLASEELLRINAWGTGDDRHGAYVAASPEGMLDVTQPEMESVLLKNAAERGANLAFQTEYLSHIQDDDGVTVSFRNRISGHEYDVRARYLIGADGARSRVADDAGLPLVGDEARATTAYVQFNADLSHLVAHRPSILYWIASPSAQFGEIGMGLLRTVRPWTEWIAGWGHDPEAGPPDFSEESLLKRIHSMIGDSSVEVQVTATSTWLVNQAFAEVYSVGRVFCGGDAVHRHPPSGGLGSNTSIQDAFNLAWKLAYVINGHAHPSLLETYSDERAPIGRQIVDRANKSRREFAELNASFRSITPSEWPDGLLAKLGDPSPASAELRDALMKGLAIKNYEFNAHGVEMNQRYESGCVIQDAAEREIWPHDAELHYQPSTRPGAKLPHAWLVNQYGRRISTLDVVGRGKTTLITGISGRAWVEAVKRMDLPWLDSVTVGDLATRDLYRSWALVREVDEAGALLVRPDGYIAWRHAEAEWSEDDAEHKLRLCVDKLMAWSAK